MQSVVLSKLSHLTHKCSLDADSHISSETYNMTVEVSLPREMVLCLWGNVAKNPRFEGCGYLKKQRLLYTFYHWYNVRLKDFSFKERSFTLELPKPLILADTLVSVLYPPFDHLTPLARYTLVQWIIRGSTVCIPWFTLLQELHSSDKHSYYFRW